MTFSESAAAGSAAMEHIRSEQAPTMPALILNIVFSLWMVELRLGRISNPCVNLRAFRHCLDAIGPPCPDSDSEISESHPEQGWAASHTVLVGSPWIRPARHSAQTGRQFRSARRISDSC